MHLSHALCVAPGRPLGPPRAMSLHALGGAARPHKPKPHNKVVATRLTKVARQLVDLMVWEGFKRADAANQVGISASWSYALMASTPVIAYMNEQLDLRRKGERPRNFHRLTELRDQDENRNAAVAAIKVLEHVSEDAGARAGVTVSPGFVIQVNVGAHQPTRAVTIDNMPVSTVIEAQPTQPDDDEILYIDGRDA